MCEPELSPPSAAVVVTCFNVGKYLADALASVRAQTCPAFELLVVDDGSSDRATIRVLWEMENAGTKVVRTSNRGLPAARNFGISLTTAPYVCCLDGDDLLLPQYLERSVEILDAQPAADFASHWLEAFGDEQWRWEPQRCDLEMLLDANTVNGAALFRRSLWSRIGGFDESMRDGCEDWEFWIRATASGASGVIIPEVLHRYRRRPDSMSRTMDKAKLYREIVHRHSDQFRESLEGLVLHREQTLAALAGSIASMEREVEEYLEPALEERRWEVETAQRRLREQRRMEGLEQARRLAAWEAAESRTRADWLAGEREASRTQLDEVLRSWSWRLTAPVRWLGAAALACLSAWPRTRQQGTEPAE